MTVARPRPSIAALLLVVPLLAAATVWLQAARERTYPPAAIADESLYVDGRAAGRLVFAFRPLAADLYWIRAIQYYGSRHLALRALVEDPLAPPPALAAAPPITYEQLYPLLDITTTLDPRFTLAYRYGAIFLSQSLPTGAGRPDLAIRLLEKGARASPDRWQYLHDIAFVYYWELHDYVSAARYLIAAADLPGAPAWLRVTAASMLAKGGQRQASRMMWQQMYSDPPDERSREAAALKLRQLDALDQIDELQAIVDRYARTRGALPAAWSALAAAGLLRRVPLDPDGTPYDLVDGRVTLSRRSPLYPLPIEPGGPNPQPPS